MGTLKEDAGKVWAEALIALEIARDHKAADSLVETLEQMETAAYKLVKGVGSAITPDEHEALQMGASTDFAGPLPEAKTDSVKRLPGANRELAMALQNLLNEHPEHGHPEIAQWRANAIHRQNLSLNQAGMVLGPFYGIKTKEDWNNALEPDRNNPSLRRAVELFQVINEKGIYGLSPTQARELTTLQWDSKENSALMQDFAGRAGAFIQSEDFAEAIRSIARLRQRDVSEPAINR